MNTVERKPAPAGPSPEEEAKVLAEREEIVAECRKFPKSTPPISGVDANGRLLPISDEEWAARMEHLPKILEEIAADVGEEDTDENWELFMRNIDEERRRSGMRTLYEGMY